MWYYFLLFFYQNSIKQVLIYLISFAMQYSLANSREERKNLYLVLFDYVLNQINETCIATGVNEYSDDEIQPLAALLTLADAPEAFYISVKLGVEGIGEILRRSISSKLSRYPNSERLNMVMSQKCVWSRLVFIWGCCGGVLFWILERSFFPRVRRNCLTSIISTNHTWINTHL